MQTTDARLREATSMELTIGLRKLFSALPLRRGDVDSQLEGYLIALRGATYYALDAVVLKIIRGEIDGMSRTFAPTPPELSAALRSEMDFVQKQIALAQERMQLEDKRPVGVKPLLLDDRISAARQRMADEGRKELFRVSSHADFMSRRKAMPAGSTYCSILGAVYGAPGYVPPQAEPVMPEPAPPSQTDDMPW